MLSLCVVQSSSLSFKELIESGLDGGTWLSGNELSFVHGRIGKIRYTYHGTNDLKFDPRSDEPKNLPDTPTRILGTPRVKSI